MAITPVFFTITLAKGTWARVYLNDLPLYKSPYMGPDSRSGPANYLLMPGENRISVELNQIEDHPQERVGAIDFRKDAIKVQIYTVDNPEAPEGTKLARTILLDVEFPQIFDDTAEEHRHYPFHYERSFDLDVPELHTPLFATAPEMEFGCEGDSELVGVVQGIYALLEKGDYDGFINALELKFRCDEQALSGVSGAPTAAEKIRVMREELIAYDPKPSEPLDVAMLHFHPRRNGSVAHVTRFDDQYVLEVACQKDPKRRIRTDLLMIQHQGRWRVFA
jgi:hypothetical protein